MLRRTKKHKRTLADGQRMPVGGFVTLQMSANASDQWRRLNEQVREATRNG